MALTARPRNCARPRRPVNARLVRSLFAGTRRRPRVAELIGRAETSGAPGQNLPSLAFWIPACAGMSGVTASAKSIVKAHPESGLLHPEVVHAGKRGGKFRFELVPAIEIGQRPAGFAELAAIVLRRRLFEFESDKSQTMRSDKSLDGRGGQSRLLHMK